MTDDLWLSSQEAAALAARSLNISIQRAQEILTVARDSGEVRWIADDAIVEHRVNKIREVLAEREMSLGRRSGKGDDALEILANSAAEGAIYQQVLEGLPIDEIKFHASDFLECLGRQAVAEEGQPVRPRRGPKAGVGERVKQAMQAGPPQARQTRAGD
jgi:hypothetical protein